MTIIIKKRATKTEVEALLLKLNKPKKSIGLRKFLGKSIISDQIDAVEYQRKLRNEWN